MSVAPRPRALGARLATATAAIAGLAIALFALVMAVVVVLVEEDDDDARAGDDAIDEVVEQIALAMAVTAPVVLGLTVVVGRRVGRRLAGRIDGVIGEAAAITHDDLGRRLSVSPARDELDALAGALNALLDRIDRGLADQRQFVADASHELRSPLAVLRTELEVARHQPRSAVVWESLADRVMIDIVRMTEMLDALLRLARVGANAPSAALVEVAAVVDEVADRLAPLAAATGVRLVVVTDDSVVAGDGEALAVALGNLVKNAIGHSPAGAAVEIAVATRGDQIEVIVDDAGPGVASHERARIFVPFARGAAGADRARAGGVGLGLSVARRIAQAHRGDVVVTEAPAGGARFVLCLRRCDATNRP